MNNVNCRKQLNKSTKTYISPSKGISKSGNLIISILCIISKGLGKVLGFDLSTPKEFEENPRYMKWREVLYLGYKYYGKNLNVGEPIGKSIQFTSNLEKVLIPEQSKALERLNINIGGDLMPYRIINQKQAKDFWKESSGFFAADLTAANLETPIAPSKPASFVPELMLSNMLFNSNEEQFQVFTNNQTFDVLSVANNHSLDQGYDGLDETLNFLKEKNIQNCGAGMVKETTCMTEKKGFKIGWMSWTFSLNQFTVEPHQELKINLQRFNKAGEYSIEPLKKEAELLKEKGADYIILMLHTGNAYQPFPSKQTQEVFNDIITNTKVDFIAGHHPHNIQGVQEFFINGMKKIAAYSLGDFVAYDIYQRSHLNMYLSLQLIKKNGVVQLEKFKLNLNYLKLDENQIKLIPFEKARKEKNNKIKELELLCNLTLGTNYS